MRDHIFEAYKLTSNELIETTVLLSNIYNLLGQVLCFTPEPIKFFAIQQINQSVEKYDIKMKNLESSLKEVIDSYIIEQ